MTITGVDNEVTSIDDALLALRMTEDTLIWFYKNKSVQFQNDREMEYK